MEIIIGRDQQTRQLRVVKDGCSNLYGQPGCVPMDVSRRHMSLQPAENGKWLIKNLNERNVTFVNGISIESKVVNETDKVELGNSHYLLPWMAFQEPKVETIDIRHLKKVWNTYNQTNINIRKRQKNLGLLTSLPIAFTMLGGLLSGVATDAFRPYAYIFTGIAFSIMLYGLYRRATDDSIEEQEAAKKRFQRDYVCPKCKRFLQSQDYEVLADACPYCRTKFKK